jgi:multidrug resistance efflux pump
LEADLRSALEAQAALSADATAQEIADAQKAVDDAQAAVDAAKAAIDAEQPALEAAVKDPTPAVADALADLLGID